MTIHWRGSYQEIPGSSLLQSLVRFAAEKEELSFAADYTDDPAVKGPLTMSTSKKRKYPTIRIPKEGSLGGSFHSKRRFSSLARMRAYVIDGQDVPRDMKVYVCVLIDILHEMGHVKKHFSAEGKSLLDMERYAKDLEYRLQIEDEAEAFTTKWCKQFGLYDFVNDATKLSDVAKL